METENTFVQPSIPKFYGHYDHWEMLMENFLRSKEHFIRQRIIYSQDNSQEDTSKDIWDSVKKKYQGSMRALRKESETLHMKAGEMVNDYFFRTLTIVNKMKAKGEHKSNRVVEKILRFMTSKFN
ncbi:hypothetical protein J1N35_042951 [Gossypium stocksii]|uniref:Uncharacterized protein n=1 Tax=Gossypium stocksii TaxID=47602 RepID=A0A9D3U6J8_9ROSI|nr:hypothetical protein J1N35_042951 [Gossypium stocksii]